MNATTRRSQPSRPDDRSDSNRVGRWVGIGVIGLLAVLVLLLGLAPTILSTDFGRRLLTGAIGNAIQGSVTIDELALRWFGGQRIGGLTLRDPQGTAVVTLVELSTDLSLLDAVRGRFALGRTQIRGVTADIVVDERGDNNLGKAVAPTESSSGAGPVVIPFTGSIELRDSRVGVTAPGIAPVVFEQLQGAVEFVPDQRLVTVELGGRSRQGDSAGEFRVTGRAVDVVSADGRLTPADAAIELQAQARDLPLEGIDGAFGLRGLLAAALGQRANLTAQATGTADTQRITINADAPKASLALTGVVREQRFELTQPAVARLTLTPALVTVLAEQVPSASLPQLAAEVPLVLTVERCTLPLSTFQLGAMAVRAELLADKPVVLTGLAGAGNFTVKQLSASVASERLRSSVDLALSGDLITDGNKGALRLQGNLSDLFDGEDRLRLDTLRADVTADLDGVPTAMVDQLAGQDGLLVDLLGPRLSVGATVRSADAGQLDAVLNIDAGPLTAKDIGFTIQDTIALSRPAEIRYALGLAGKRLLEPITVTPPAPLVVRIERLVAPRPKAGEPLFQPDKTGVRAALDASRLQLAGIGGPEPVTFDALHVDINADTLARVRIAGSTQLQQPAGGLLSELAASPLAVRINGTGGLAADGALNAAQGTVEVSSQQLNAHLAVQSDPGSGAMRLVEPAAITFSLTPALLPRLGVGGPEAAMLAAPAPVDLQVTRLDLPLAEVSLAAVSTSFTARVAGLALRDDPRMPGAAINDLVVNGEFDGPGAAATIGARAGTAVAGATAPGSLAIDARLTHLLRDGAIDPTAAAVDATARITQLPTAVVEAFGDMPGTLVPLLGETLNVDGAAKLAGDDKRAGTVELKARSANLVLDAGLKVDEALSLNRPATARLTLTPQGYAALTSAAGANPRQEPVRYVLRERTTVDAVIDDLRWPLGAAGFDASRAGLQATLKLPQLALTDRQTGGAVSVDALQLALRGPNLAQPIELNAVGEVRGAAAKGVPPAAEGAGRLTVNGRVVNALTPEGRFNGAGMSLQLDGRLERFPVALLDTLLTSEGMLLAALGENLDLQLAANLVRMAGPLSLQLRSSNAASDIKAELREQGLVLVEPLTAQMGVNPALGKQLLAKIHPIFETTQGSDRPLRLQINRDGVLIPVKDFEFAKVVIPQVVVDPGKLTLQSGWLLKGIIGLAQQVGALGSTARDQWIAWFTPAVFQVRDGKIAYTRRLDVLLDKNLHLGTWGVTDVSNDRVDLTLAFMDDTLAKVFKLTVNPGDAFRIPITGALSAPSVDFGKATLEIARLKGQERLIRKDSLTGALVGALAGTAVGGGPIPQASVSPLPWGSIAPVQQGGQPGRAPEPAAPVSPEQRAIEGVLDLLKKKK